MTVQTEGKNISWSDRLYIMQDYFWGTTAPETVPLFPKMQQDVFLAIVCKPAVLLAFECLEDEFTLTVSTLVVLRSRVRLPLSASFKSLYLSGSQNFLPQLRHLEKGAFFVV